MTKSRGIQFQVPRHWPLSRRLAHYTAPPDENGCTAWTGLIEFGYGLMDYQGKKQRAHRLAWEAKNGPISPGFMVCHRCDNRACINVGHLFVDTHDANMADMVAKDRQAKGEAQGNALLTAEQVFAIRDDGRLMRVIAEQYGVSRSCISLIKRRKAWRHI